ncbi:MAG: Na+/H+ antiporter subunit E [Ignisphaera sp.]
MKFTRIVIIFVLFFLFYIGFSGLVNELTVFTGLVTATVSVLFIEILNLIKFDLGSNILKRFVYALKYLKTFVVAEVVEHLKVTKIILSRKLAINPAIVEIPTSLKSDLAITIAALTITNTPGTIAVDFDKDNNVLYVHWLNQEAFEINKIKSLVLGDLEETIKNMIE